MKTILIFILAAFSIPCFGQATTVVGNSVARNSLVVSRNPDAKLYAVLGYNGTGSTEFVQVFSGSVVPASGAVPIFSMPVQGYSAYSYDFSYYGANLDGITVCISTTANSLTLASASSTIQAIVQNR
ncbi:MAG: hypothetical protein KGJ13_06885 [Patescibacteria group bacterium]|nr:hypothetical protein [Patescibacteria group bacterium]